MSEGPYFIEHGDVWYREPERGRTTSRARHVCDGTEELAIAHDGEMLLKTGSAVSVAKWEEANREKFRVMCDAMSAMGHEAPEMRIVNLPVHPAIVEEINFCIATSGRVSRLESNLERIGSLHPDLFARPSYPR